jgi:cation:H+ antiporter
LLVLSYIIYSLYSIYSHRGKDGDNKIKRKFEIKALIIIIVSAIFVYLGANYTIDSVIEISNILNINSSIIALSAIAIGTSLPEVLVSVMAARKKQYEMALGNVFGSNIFNIAMVIGIPSFISELNVSTDTLMLAVPFVILATLLYVISSISQKIHNWEGAMYLIIYLLFIGKLFGIL